MRTCVVSFFGSISSFYRGKLYVGFPALCSLSKHQDFVVSRACSIHFTAFLARLENIAFISPLLHGGSVIIVHCVAFLR